MDNKTALFLMEMFATPTELGLLKALREDPRDEASKRAYIDFLRENGREGSADAIEKEHWIPTIGHVYPKMITATSGVVISGSLGSGSIGFGHIGSGQIGTFYFGSGNIG